MNAQTRKNLEQAMHDEAFSFARYMAYGRKARSRGHSELADALESLADVEMFDYFMNDANLFGLGSGTDIESLQVAIEAETRSTDMYSRFEVQARDAGEIAAADEFARVRADKQRSQTKLTELLTTLETPAPRPHHILVIADETCHGSGLCDEISYRAGRVPSEVLIVAPALTGSRLHYLLSDLDQEKRLATERVETLHRELQQKGVPSTGRTGDANPLLAIEDALREFPADEIVIATHPPEDSTWLERKLVDEARERFTPLLVTHVVIDPTVDRGATLAQD